jgi:hypothetical protein
MHIIEIPNLPRKREEYQAVVNAARAKAARDRLVKWLGGGLLAVVLAASGYTAAANQPPPAQPPYYLPMIASD